MPEATLKVICLSQGPEQWLSSEECLMLLQRAAVQFLVPTSYSFQTPRAPTPESSTALPWPQGDLNSHQVHTHTHPYEWETASTVSGIWQCGCSIPPHLVALFWGGFRGVSMSLRAKFEIKSFLPILVWFLCLWFKTGALSFQLGLPHLPHVTPPALCIEPISQGPYTQTNFCKLLRQHWLYFVLWYFVLSQQ